MSQDPANAASAVGRHESPVAQLECERPAGDSPNGVQIADEIQLNPIVDASTCPTCGAANMGSFCATCGQRRRPTRLSIRSVASDIISRVTSADTGFVFTALRLTVAPGVVVRDFIGGRTVVYTHPFGYLVFAFAAFAILSGVFGGTSGTGGAENRLFFALIIPCMAFVARVLFWRSDLNYAEHLIASGYVIAHVALFFGVIQAAIPLVTAIPAAWASYALLFGALGLGIGYVAWAYSRIFAGRPLLGMAGGLLSLAGGIALWGVFMMALLHLIRG